MQRYKVTRRWVNIHSGVVQIDAKLASQYGENLDDNGDGTYQVLNPIQLPLGTVFGHDRAVHEFSASKVAKTSDEGGAKKLPESRAASVVEAGAHATAEAEAQTTAGPIRLSQLDAGKIRQLVEKEGGKWDGQAKGRTFLLKRQGYVA